MASVCLDREEVEEEDLPAVCMCCGAPATQHVRKVFSWYPPWVLVLLLAGVIPFAIVASVLSKRMRIAAPLCGAHKGHWFRRALLVWLSLLALIVLSIGLIVLVSMANRQLGHGGDLSGWVCLGIVVLLVGWIVLVAVQQYTAIRPTEITDLRMTLTSVSPEFVQALQEHRRQRYHVARPDHWDDAGRHFRPRSKPSDAYREDDPPPR